MHLELFYYISILPYLNNLCGRHIPLSFSVIYWLLVVSRHSCQFVVSSVVEFLCFITLSISFSHLTPARPHRCLFSGDQVICYPPCLLRVHSVSTCRPHFFPKLFAIFPFFSLITSFLKGLGWRSG